MLLQQDLCFFFCSCMPCPVLVEQLLLCHVSFASNTRSDLSWAYATPDGTMPGCRVVPQRTQRVSEEARGRRQDEFRSRDGVKECGPLLLLLVGFVNLPVSSPSGNFSLIIFFSLGNRCGLQLVACIQLLKVSILRGTHEWRPPSSALFFQVDCSGTFSSKCWRSLGTMFHTFLSPA